MSGTTHPEFAADYAPSDLRLVEAMLARNVFDDGLKARIFARGEKYIEAIRSAPKGAALEDFMQEYSLSTKEGLSLMVLAEALLRIPDAETQNRLIEDKIGTGAWEAPDGDEGWLLMAASWGIGLSARIVRPDETPGGVLDGLVKRLGVPVIRTGTRQAMQYLGYNFVLGQTIGGALDRAAKQEKRGYRYSYDMLGEGARTHADARRYFEAYAEAIDRIAKKAPRSSDAEVADRPGISVKLSALHPRYFLKNRDDLMASLVPSLASLAQQAKAADLGFTMDAEEADRLDISLDIFSHVAADPSLAGWDGFGLAVQAYQKRAPKVIQYIDDLAQALDRRFMVRLVKGAYWDTEIKRAQERGLEGFPVFTKKAATDLCYIDCAQLLLAARPRLYPQFATHNALTMATLIELGGKDGFEFQRLHGMGETLYDEEMREAGLPVRIYAPVGGYKDLLAYLVRRMLENAANSSFVAQVADEKASMEDILAHPQDELRDLVAAGEAPVHSRIRAPLRLYPGRRNSRGAELGHKSDLRAFEVAVATFAPPERPIGSIVGGGDRDAHGKTHPITNPANLDAPLGEWIEASADDVSRAVEVAASAFPAWNGLGPHARADLLRKFADLLELHRNRFIGALVREAGKTIDDALSEVRESIDFCRYYAGMAEDIMPPRDLPGPVGEKNIYSLEGRGVFAAIAPWNFPLAIFLGQITAAMASGNCVVAKPAPQTPLIGYMAVDLMREAGIPAGVCNMVLGGGAVGAWLTSDPRIAGVVFTGSTATAGLINRTLAERDGPIIPLIAETGGVNAMIVDSTALPEQVADDVTGSAFRSAGQRCSALRMLYVQEDVSDTMLEMIVGAAEAMRFGDPARFDNDVGPVIDQVARDRLDAHWRKMCEIGEVLYEGPEVPGGTFMAPRIVELPALDSLKTEAFGPILHVARYRADELDDVLSAIRSTGYGLTFGIHTRLEARSQEIAARAEAGNIYINRNMVGAVVGVQPFGGRGLSGTGPKAGGPYYLTRFCEERLVSENTTAAGGNASLIAMSDE